jgi:hypothetical protein
MQRGLSTITLPEGKATAARIFSWVTHLFDSLLMLGKRETIQAKRFYLFRIIS